MPRSSTLTDQLSSRISRHPAAASRIKYLPVLAAVFAILMGCQRTAPEGLVSNPDELRAAIANAKPGTNIVMANGVWKDVQIRLIGNGTQDQPITLRAETPGEVIIKGQSDLQLAGEHLVVDGLFFTEGASPSRAVIQFFIDDDTLANHSRVTNCVIKDFNKAQRNMQDLWILFKGRHNQLDHCYLSGKSNLGPTIRVELAGNQSVYNYHRITRNHFGPRPPRGGPSAETIQIGNSSTSMTPSHTLIANNLFDRTNGEVEVISSKSNFNAFRNNVFYRSEGSLVTRHGNYAIVDGNYFIGDGESPHYGGLRIIGTGHWITNNYFYNLRGTGFRAPLALMNGIRRPVVNRYFQVTDVVVAHNTWINSPSPWQIGVGSNVDQRDVLPPSEIRSETPVRTLLANNIIYNDKGDPMPILRYDDIDGVEFRSNVINNQGVAFQGVDGLVEKEFSMKQVQEHVLVPASDLSDVEVYSGFEFDKITSDLFGNSRSDTNVIGATVGSSDGQPDIMALSNYGPAWYDPNPRSDAPPQTYAVGSADELVAALAKAAAGDTIELTAENFEIGSPLAIDKQITIRSADAAGKSLIRYAGPAATPAFEMHPKGHLRLQSVALQGNGDNYAFASLRENMSSLYNLEVEDSAITDFEFVLKAYKYSFAEFITFRSTTIGNCSNGLELSGEDDDRGDYNAENVYIIDSRFDRVDSNVIDYYRGGYDESTVGGNLVVRGSTFTRSGSEEENGVLINTYGIINVSLSGNTFTNNGVDLVARLWGAKNNSHADNVIQNSGKIVVEQNLPQKLVY